MAEAGSAEERVRWMRNLVESEIMRVDSNGRLAASAALAAETHLFDASLLPFSLDLVTFLSARN